VSAFNRRTRHALDETETPAVAVASTVAAATALWWDHRAVLSASFELSPSVPEVYDRAVENLAIVRVPTVALLQRYGTVPKAADLGAAMGPGCGSYVHV
jgi:hypothetical protein